MTKQFLFLLVCMFLSVFVVNAEECTLVNYEKYANNLKFKFEQMGDSKTFKIYVSNISGGISVESGRWLSSDGFLDYITYGSSKYANIFVSDGSSCSGKMIKTIELKVNEKIKYVENNENEIVIDQSSANKENEVGSNIIVKDELPDNMSFDEEFKESEQGDECDKVLDENNEALDNFEPPIINQKKEFKKEDEKNINIKLIISFFGIMSVLIAWGYYGFKKIKNK